ncbi:MAG: hypothetical protein R3281_17420 [Balneolaceae bacterium]|nr:hypothetical protein [Balneolaceae bacterium]
MREVKHYFGSALRGPGYSPDLSGSCLWVRPFYYHNQLPGISPCPFPAESDENRVSLSLSFVTTHSVTAQTLAPGAGTLNSHLTITETMLPVRG